MLIFSSINNWIPQPDRTEARLASGLHVVRQSFVFAGTPTTSPYAEGDSWDGFKVYPQPEVSQSSAGIYSSTVTAYSIWTRLSGTPPISQAVFETTTSRLLKTGTLLWSQTSGGTTTTTSHEFEYLAPRVHTKIAAPTESLPAPSAPAPIYSDAITVTRTPFSYDTQQRTWALTSYEVENFGDFSQVSYIYEIFAGLTKSTSS